MTQNPTVYALIDPDTGRVHYVGRTRNLDDRYVAHLSESGPMGNEKQQWIWSVHERGQLPALAILETPESIWVKGTEQKWIHELAVSGEPLTNKHHISQVPEPEIESSHRFSMPGSGLCHRDCIDIVVDAVRQNQGKSDGIGAPLNDVIAAAASEQVTEEGVHHIIATLKTRGTIYTPSRNDHYKLVAE